MLQNRFSVRISDASFVIRSFGCLLAVACGILLSEPAAATQIVNIDLEGYRTGGGGTDTLVPPTTYVGQGAAGGGTVFNGMSPSFLSDNTNSPTTGDNQTYSASGLLNSTGGATSVGFSIGPVGVDNENTNIGVPTDSQALFNDYMFNNSAGNAGNTNFTISGLVPGASYDVYLYAGFANAASFLANTSITGGTLTSFANTGIFTSGGNTDLWTVHANGSGDINGVMGSGVNILAGVTLFSTVPEPSTGLLAGCSLLGFLLLRRKRVG